MASGAEHYARAEHLVSSWEAEYATAANTADGAKMQVLEELSTHVLAAAAVHATLALTRATLVQFEAADWNES